MIIQISKDNKTEIIGAHGVETSYLIRHKTDFSVLEYWTQNLAEAFEQFRYVNKNGKFFNPQA